MNLQWLEELCDLNGTSGREHAVRDWLIAHLPAGVAYEVDPLGNLIVNKTLQNVMLCAHMDEVGMIVTYITGEGYLKFAHVGGIDPAAYLGRQVFVSAARLPGVIGLAPMHLLESSETKRIPKEESLYIDIGATSREDAAQFINLGDLVAFAPGFVRFGEGYIKSKALDDRAGCLILLELLHKNPSICAVFSAREEIGGAAVTAAYALAPRRAIVLETTTAADLPGIEGTQRVCALGGGAVVPFMDKGTVYPFDLYGQAMALAETHGIPAQTKTLVAGGNDAHSIHTARGGVPTLTVSVPCRNLHSPACVMKESDADAVFDLAQRLWEAWK